MNYNTTITIDSTSNLDHPYTECTDPDMWDKLATVLDEMVCETLAEDKRLLFNLPVDGTDGGVMFLGVTIDRTKFWKFCGEVRYVLTPTSNGDILSTMEFHTKKYNKYNLEQLKNEVRHIRDMGLDFTGFESPMGRVPGLISIIGAREEGGKEYLTLNFLPEGTTLNGREFNQDGEKLVEKDGSHTYIGPLVEAV